MKSIYQHCGKQHLHRYRAEFDFRYSNRKAFGIEDTERADIALVGIVGKRLTYQTIGVWYQKSKSPKAKQSSLSGSGRPFRKWWTLAN